MNDRSFRGTFVVLFAIAYAVIYGFVAKFNWPLFTYGSHTGEFTWFLTLPSSGNAMVYYGWIFMAAICAAAVAGIVAILPFGRSKPVWHGLAWVIPVLGMLFFANAMKGYFWFEKIRGGSAATANAQDAPARGIAPATIAAQIKIEPPPAQH